MGRQIQIAATLLDEHDFLRFVRRISDITIFGIFTETKEALWVDSFRDDPTDHWKYGIWNQAFDWTPEYRQTKDKGLFYISNTNFAPVIEFTRSDVPKRKYGRIYWAKEFLAPKGLNYDVDAFSKWFDKIVRWVRKNGQKDQRNNFSPYFLPDAWKIYRGAQQGHSL